MESPRLFAHLYLDEDVDILVASLVRGQGLAVTTARDEDMLGQRDQDHLSFASERGWVLVTHNRVDFEELAARYFEENRTHAGIVCAFRRPPREVAARLISLANERTADELRNQLAYI